MHELTQWVGYNPAATVTTVLLIFKLVDLIFKEGSENFRSSGWIPLVSLLLAVVVLLVSISVAPYLDLAFGGNIGFILGSYIWFRYTKKITYSMRRMETGYKDKDIV